jgi:hypothetical protein
MAIRSGVYAAQLFYANTPGFKLIFFAKKRKDNGDKNHRVEYGGKILHNGLRQKKCCGFTLCHCQLLRREKELEMASEWPMKLFLVDFKGIRKCQTSIVDDNSAE